MPSPAAARLEAKILRSKRLGTTLSPAEEITVGRTRNRLPIRRQLGEVANTYLDELARRLQEPGREESTRRMLQRAGVLHNWLESTRPS